MENEDPLAGRDPETIRKGSLRVLRVLFPNRFPNDPDAAVEEDEERALEEEPFREEEEQARE